MERTCTWCRKYIDRLNDDWRNILGETVCEDCGALFDEKVAGPKAANMTVVAIVKAVRKEG